MHGGIQTDGGQLAEVGDRRFDLGGATLEHSAVTFSTTARPRLRKPTSVASVATNGGKPDHGDQPGVQAADQKADGQRARDGAVWTAGVRT